MKYEGLLPIGSVVMLDGGTHRVMVTGYAQRKVSDPEHKLFDYAGCLHPEGMISADQTILFNHSAVRTIYALGYTDDNSQAFIRNAETQLAAIRAKDGSGEEHA